MSRGRLTYSQSHRYGNTYSRTPYGRLASDAKKYFNVNNPGSRGGLRHFLDHTRPNMATSPSGRRTKTSNKSNRARRGYSTGGRF